MHTNENFPPELKDFIPSTRVPDRVDMEITNRMKVFLRSRGVALSRFDKKCGVSYGSIYQWFSKGIPISRYPIFAETIAAIIAWERKNKKLWTEVAKKRRSKNEQN